MIAEILKIRRKSDCKEFEIDDQVWVDGIYQGNIVYMFHFPNEVKIAVNDGSEADTFYSLKQLD